MSTNKRNEQNIHFEYSTDQHTVMHLNMVKTQIFISENNALFDAIAPARKTMDFEETDKTYFL